ncbi:5-formyltetrahydrofolate cyclo-ligase [Seongchinamella sediminis]|uniref:5-formyltetrahydrofolate cyclo-ligase n=1 Tax=Seongchinamella sediminis TaxID=2283635 RepID=A0A3L7E3H6_9GAMM|nr:5-formyltetrahydrofolate cyclo-ligase [Seongchinamella sediminis]RLQ23475.1 5-formyltetrahydrofolate cyclo-ligase [Seongchinamella sediminis]
MEDLPLSKAVIRRDMRSRRRALPASKRQQAAEAVTRQLASLALWQRARRIAVYHANDGEIDPTPLVRDLRRAGKTPYLPIIQTDSSLRFAAWEADQPLIDNRFGIPEPGGKSLPASALDIILLPLVAWDLRGNRLGMGGGFYDRALESAADVIKMGLAYDCQQLPALPSQPWDVPLDFVVTESALYQCQGHT